jgi:hypothetical protein
VFGSGIPTTTFTSYGSQQQQAGWEGATSSSSRSSGDTRSSATKRVKTEPEANSPMLNRLFSAVQGAVFGAPATQSASQQGSGSQQRQSSASNHRYSPPRNSPGDGGDASFDLVDLTQDEDEEEEEDEDEEEGK